jgi:hypothetical protein
MTYFLFWNNTYTSFPSDKILREVSPIHTKQSEDLLPIGHSDVWDFIKLVFKTNYSSISSMVKNFA